MRAGNLFARRALLGVVGVLVGVLAAAACSDFSDEPASPVDSGIAETSASSDAATDRAPLLDAAPEADAAPSSPCEAFVDATICDDFSATSLRPMWTPHIVAALPDGGVGPLGTIGLVNMGLGPPGVEALVVSGIDNGGSALRLTTPMTVRVRTRADFRVVEGGDAGSDYVTLMSMVAATQPPINVGVDANQITNTSYLKVVDNASGTVLVSEPLGAVTFGAWSEVEIGIDLSILQVTASFRNAGMPPTSKTATLTVANSPSVSAVLVQTGISQASSRGGPTRVQMDNFALWAE